MIAAGSRSHNQYNLFFPDNQINLFNQSTIGRLLPQDRLNISNWILTIFGSPLSEPQALRAGGRRINLKKATNKSLSEATPPISNFQ
jgi:hypothetical protein